MARSYAQLHTSIWRDRDFCDLPAHAQRVYLLAISQANVSYAGVVPFTEKRWAAMAGDTTRGDIADAINVLEDRGYVILDHDTEELWVRSWCKYNGVFGQPNLRKSMRAAYETILSTAIKRAHYDSLPDDEKALLTTPPEAEPRAKRGASEAKRPTDIARDLDLDLDLHCSTSPSSSPAGSPTDLEPPEAKGDEDVIHAAAKILAQRKLERLKGTPGEVHVPSKWLPPVIEETWRNHVENAERIIAAREKADPPKPPLTAEQLADRLEPPANYAPKEAEPHPLDTTLAASLALAEEGTRYAQEIAALPRDPQAASRLHTIRMETLHGERKGA